MNDQPTRRGRETVARIIDAACDLFDRQGIRGTTLDQVGKASRTGRGQLYHYFDSKTDLVTAVVHEQVERTVGASVSILDDIKTSHELRGAGSAVALHYSQPGEALRCPLGALINELGPGDEAARAVLAAGFDRWREAWARTLTRLQDTGSLRPEVDPDLSAVALLATYQGAILMAAVHHDTAVIQASLDAVIDHIVLTVA